MPNKIGMDDVRRYYGMDHGAPKKPIGLSDWMCRRLAQRSYSTGSTRPMAMSHLQPSGSGHRVAAPHRESIGTTKPFQPGHIPVSLVNNPLNAVVGEASNGTPIYKEVVYSPSDPWGKWLNLILEGDLRTTAVYATIPFFYNGSKPLRFDYAYHFYCDRVDHALSVVIAEYATGWGTGASSILHSKELTTTASSWQTYNGLSTQFNTFSGRPYKLVNVELSTKITAARGTKSYAGLANMYVTEAV